MEFDAAEHIATDGATRAEPDKDLASGATGTDASPALAVNQRSNCRPAANQGRTVVVAHTLDTRFVILVRSATCGTCGSGGNSAIYIDASQGSAEG
jgi:hypothetical protein